MVEESPESVTYRLIAFIGRQNGADLLLAGSDGQYSVVTPAVGARIMRTVSREELPKLREEFEQDPTVTTIVRFRRSQAVVLADIAQLVGAPVELISDAELGEMSVFGEDVV